MTKLYPNSAPLKVKEPHTALSLTASDADLWEKEFEFLSGVSRISEGNHSHLCQLLSIGEDTDSYLTSPTYYLFTGRNGLWVYESNGAFLLVCWHPNVLGQILIFPQFGESKSNLIQELLPNMPRSPEGIRLARVKAGSEDKKEIVFESCAISFERQTEKILDWTYPVRILSTTNVAELAGRKYMYIRNRVRQLDKHSTEVLPFDPINHSKALENILHQWAVHNAADREEYELLYAPYEALFSQSVDPLLGLSGLMIYVDGKLEAVALWDVSNRVQRTANLFVNFCNKNIRGLSEFLLVRSCGVLRDRGIEYVNLGGSETHSLDTYKKKFDPVLSVELCSVAVETDAAAIHQIQPMRVQKKR